MRCSIAGREITLAAGGAGFAMNDDCGLAFRQEMFIAERMQE